MGKKAERMKTADGIVSAESPLNSGTSPAGQRHQIPEKLLASLWQKRAARQRRFKTDGGRLVQVLYPGRPNSGAGPDFRDAVFHLEGLGMVHGSVEIHHSQRDWNSHGHGTDANFNRVALHAVLEDIGQTTFLPNGQKVPVISLASLLKTDALPSGPEARDSSEPSLWTILEQSGFSQPGDSEEMAHLLDRAGDARFLRKSARFRTFLAEEADPAEQILYEALGEALGYRHNQQTFVKLAQRAKYQSLRSYALAIPPEDRRESIEAQLLQLSGLANSQSTHPTPGNWGPSMMGSEWHCFRVRPANHPRRRIAGLAALLSKYLDSGLLSGLLDAAQGAKPGQLVSALQGVDPGCRSLIGAGRARDMAVNVVLPFYHALTGWDDRGLDPEVFLDAYRRFGPLQDNELLREMKDLLMEPCCSVPLSSARRQQGMLHLHHLLRGGG